MMYLGGKSRSAKQILFHVLKDRRAEQLYIEPFVGGGNVIHNVTGPRIGNDINKYVISLLQAIQQGWVPPNEIKEELYLAVKTNLDFWGTQYPELVGFIGFGCSFGGKFFGGYARAGNNSGRPDSNYASVASRSLLKQAKGLKGVLFLNMNYLDLRIPPNSVVYCDPPYQGTTDYKTDFDHQVFWEWALKISETSRVFVSEYTAPDNWKCIWQKEVKVQMSIEGGIQKIDRLWVPSRQSV